MKGHKVTALVEQSKWQKKPQTKQKRVVLLPKCALCSSNSKLQSLRWRLLKCIAQPSIVLLTDANTFVRGKQRFQGQPSHRPALLLRPDCWVSGFKSTAASKQLLNNGNRRGGGALCRQQIVAQSGIWILVPDLSIFQALAGRLQKYLLLIFGSDGSPWDWEDFSLPAECHPFALPLPLLGIRDCRRQYIWWPSICLQVNWQAEVLVMTACQWKDSSPS